MKKIHFLTPAETELFEAAFFYEKQVEGLGKRFTDTIEKALSTIAENPQIYPRLEKDFQKCPTSPFPYKIIFKVEQNRIVIIAVAHNKRRPNYWSERI